jgi:polysaccharide biosynthesis protein PslH
MKRNSPILILCNRVPYPLKDGGALAMHAMIKSWYDTGREVHVLAMNTSRHFVDPAILPQLYKDIASFQLVPIANEILWLPTLTNFLFSIKPQHAARFYSKGFARQLVKSILKIKPGIIQMESIFLSEYLTLIRSVSNAFLVQRLHNIEYQVWHRLAYETSNPFKKYYLKNLARRIARYEKKTWNDFDLLLPITAADETYIKFSGCKTPIHTCTFSIDRNHLPSSVKMEQWNGYHIGAMDWLPNKEAMLWFVNDIWPLVHKLAPDFSFYFAGRKMPDIFKEYHHDGLYCMDEVADANNFIADKKILIVPLRSGGGVRVKTLEAMAAGKVVISTAIGMQGIDAIDKVHYICAESATEFANAIAWCMDHKEIAQEIAQQAQELIQREYDQQKVMQSLLAYMDTF